MEEEGHAVCSAYGAAQGCLAALEMQGYCEGLLLSRRCALLVGECTALVEAYCFKTCRSSQSLNDRSRRFYLSVEDRSEIFCLAC